jgi:hypothetical protein
VNNFLAWSGPQPIDDFIAISKAGKESGVFIMHRECGTLVELNSEKGRALGKMKATITQRFTSSLETSINHKPTTTESEKKHDFNYDIDCDCRFIFFCERQPTQPDGSSPWKARFVKLFYEKDKVVPTDGHTTPRFGLEELNRYPEGYRYLGAAQARLGYSIDLQLPTARNTLWNKMYSAMEKWLDGGEPNLMWEKAKTIMADTKGDSECDSEGDE